MVQMDAAGRLVVTSAGPLSLNNTAQLILDNGCSGGNGVTSQINVTGQPSPVSSSKIAVRINITHTWDTDLRIYLYPSTGVGVLVLAAENGGSGDNFTNTIFTDQAPGSITTGAAPFTGQYRPKGGATECFASGKSLATFATIGAGTVIPNGIWTLRIFDNGLYDLGTLNYWSLSFTGPESFTTADENNYLARFNSGNLTASSIYQQPSGFYTGNIGIGTTNPTAGLDINGTLKFTDGTQGDKKVLTSDALGKASWQVPTVNQHYEKETAGLSSPVQNAIVDFPETNILAPVAGTYIITYFLDAYNSFNGATYGTSIPKVYYTDAYLFNKTTSIQLQRQRIDFLDLDNRDIQANFELMRCVAHEVSGSVVKTLSANEAIGFKMKSTADSGLPTGTEIRINYCSITLVRLY